MVLSVDESDEVWRLLDTASPAFRVQVLAKLLRELKADPDARKHIETAQFYDSYPGSNLEQSLEEMRLGIGREVIFEDEDDN